MTGCELEIQMSRLIIFIPPCHFVDRHAFTFAVDCIVLSHLQTHHVRFIFGTAGNVSIHNFIRGIILPVGRVIVISHQRSDTLGINISVGILPAFLQNKIAAG